MPLCRKRDQERREESSQRDGGEDGADVRSLRELHPTNDETVSEELNEVQESIDEFRKKYE